MSVMLRTESAILGSGCGGLDALEKHLPSNFVRRVEEPAQSLVPRRVELPQAESPLLTREECASEPSDDGSDTSWRRALFRVPVAFFAAFFSGTT